MKLSPNFRFTLLELLVVTAIIAVLASMLLPALSKTKEKGRTIQCMNNQRSIGMSLRLYADESDGRLLAAYYPGYRPTARWYWNLGLMGYGSDYTGRPGSIWACPSAAGDSPTKSASMTYARINHSRWRKVTWGAGGTWASTSWFYPIDRVSDSSSQMLITGSRHYDTGFSTTEVLAGSGYSLRHAQLLTRAYFHSGYSLNAQFADGHAETLTLQAVSKSMMDDPICP